MVILTSAADPVSYLIKYSVSEDGIFCQKSVSLLFERLSAGPVLH